MLSSIKEFPGLIKCLSTNGLLLEPYAEDLISAGVKTITVTVNAVDLFLLEKICSKVVLDGNVYEGAEGAALLIGAQKRGIKKAAKLGALVKINIVLIPCINGGHISEIAKMAKEAGAALVNIIPLIPQFEFVEYPAPSCGELSAARETAEKSLPVFRHCRHCMADSAGIPGRRDLSSLLYGKRRFFETFSHG